MANPHPRNIVTIGKQPGTFEQVQIAGHIEGVFCAYASTEVRTKDGEIFPNLHEYKKDRREKLSDAASFLGKKWGRKVTA